MPVSFERLSSAATRPQDGSRASLTIGLVNNMPDAALQATERQFVSLLGAAAGGLAVRLVPYAIPEVPRTDWGRDYVARAYAGIDELWHERVDALIVTGTEPRSPDLQDEPYWTRLTELLGWAERHTYSAIWSCLATHAAVLHLDGVARHPLEDKRFGIFECERASDHPLTRDVPPQIAMPHSRWNDLPESALAACGYRPLLRSAAGVDAFAKRRGSLFVFFQGHPEYEAQTLMLEYRRDIKRFLTGERDTYPTMPHGYFDAETVDALTALRARALADRREEVLTDFPTARAATVGNRWRAAAVGLYHNWLRYLLARRTGSARLVMRRAA